MLFFWLTLSAVDYSISCTCKSQLGLFSGLLNLVVGTLIDPSLSVMLTDANPKFTKFGFGAMTASLPRFIPQRELTSNLGSAVTLQPTTLLKLDVGPLCYAKKPSIEVWGYWSCWSIEDLRVLLGWKYFVSQSMLGSRRYCGKFELGDSTWRPLQRCWCPLVRCCPCLSGLLP